MKSGAEIYHSGKKRERCGGGGGKEGEEGDGKEEL